MSWDNIHSGNYAFVGKITCKQDGVAVDISGYSTKQFLLVPPSGAVKTVTADFDTDGTDGVLTHTFATGTIDEDGVWKVAPRLSSTGSAKIDGTFIVFHVAKPLDG